MELRKLVGVLNPKGMKVAETVDGIFLFLSLFFFPLIRDKIY